MYMCTHACTPHVYAYIQRSLMYKKKERFKAMPYCIARVVQGPQTADSSPGTTNLKDYKGHEFKAGEWFIKK